MMSRRAGDRIIVSLTVLSSRTCPNLPCAVVSPGRTLEKPLLAGICTGGGTIVPTNVNGFLT